MSARCCQHLPRHREQAWHNRYILWRWCGIKTIFIYYAMMSSICIYFLSTGISVIWLHFSCIPCSNSKESGFLPTQENRTVQQSWCDVCDQCWEGIQLCWWTALPVDKLASCSCYWYYLHYCTLFQWALQPSEPQRPSEHHGQNDLDDQNVGTAQMSQEGRILWQQKIQWPNIY